tara:strand:+ start:1366 stop:2763 length:1398 start_codon:yes stop_codon:yes gene_type:complete
MGFFSKIVKGIKKVVKKIGKGIKSVFKKVGKFMGKIGFVGQLALGLIMPYALPALGGALGGFATSLMNTTGSGVFSSIARGAGQFLNAAVKVGTRVGQVFKSVTQAVTKTIGNMVGATINTLPGGKAFGGFLKGVTGGRLDITQMNFSSAWDATQKAWSNVGSDLTKLFSKSTLDSSMNSFGIKSSLEQNMAGDFDTSNISYDAETGKLSIGPDRATGTLGNQGVGLDVADSLGLGTEGTTYKLGATPTNYVELAKMGTPVNIPEASFTAGATEGTYQASSLLDAPTSTFDAITKKGGVSLDRSVANIARQPNVPTEFDAFTNITDPASVVEGTLNSKVIEAGEKVAEQLGVKDVTLAGAAKVIRDLKGPEEVESRLPLTDYVDYSSLAVQPISNVGMGAGLASASPIQFGAYGNSLVDDIMSQNWGSIYGGGMWGFPSQMAGLTNFSSSAGQMVSGIGTDPRVA